MEASWPHRLEDWRLLLELSSGVVACDGLGAIVGTAMSWSYGAGAGTLSMILVSPTEQGKGIGRRLLGRDAAAFGAPRTALLERLIDDGRAMVIGPPPAKSCPCSISVIAGPRRSAARATDSPATPAPTMRVRAMMCSS
jgi:hypothetical protein